MSYFGTDGIRGRFGAMPITPEFVMRLGFAAGKVFSKQGHSKSVLIGKDTRLSGYVLESALQSGFNAAGVDVYLLGPLPTPAIAHLTRSFHADAGVVISASHNPFFDNGVKFFSHKGTKLSDDIQSAIESELANEIEIVNPEDIGKSYRVDDAKGRYIEFCKGSFPYRLSLRGLKVVIDCANGAGYSVAPRTLRELGADVVVIHNTPDGKNINHECGSTHPESLQQKVLEHGADAGIALDGDGDRIIMVDETGQLISGDHMLYILATQNERKSAGVVGTLMSNVGLELALKQEKINFKRANVGDRYVMAMLHEQGWTLGGEPSGHILCLNKSSTGDAIISGLQILAIMKRTGKALSELANGLTILPQSLVNVRLEQMQDPYDNPQLAEKFQQAQDKLAGRGRLLIRKSGTEPVIRVMVESETQAECDQLANELADDVRNVLAA